MSNLKKYRKVVVQCILDELKNIGNGVSGYKVTGFTKVLSDMNQIKGFELDYISDGVYCLIQAKQYESINEVELRISMKSVQMSCVIGGDKSGKIGDSLTEIYQSLTKVQLCLS